MLVPLLLAAAIASRVPHSPVQNAAQPVEMGREAPQRAEEAGPNLFAYCDASRQPTIMVTNDGSTALVVEWTLTASMPPYPPDRWSGVSTLEPGKFEGWMSPALYLHLDIRYDDDGLSGTNSIDASCQAAAGLSSGLEELSGR